MNIDELVYDLKEHLDTYCQTYDDYDMTYNQTEMIYYLIKDLEKENQKYKEVIDRAVQLAYQYAQIDGGHHKMWVIDQMMRILLGSKYDNFVKEYEEDGEYEWNIGIAP